MSLKASFESSLMCFVFVALEKTSYSLISGSCSAQPMKRARKIIIASESLISRHNLEFPPIFRTFFN